MMLNPLVASAAVGMALLMASSSFDPAEARGRGGGGARAFHGGGHARAFSGRAFHGPRVHAGRRFVRRGIGVGLVGVPLAYGAYSYGYGDGGCNSLRRRALATGSGYWWDRYYACVDGY